MRTLIDSNVLIRAHDATPSPYSAAAVKMLKELANSGDGVLSAQSLGEFAHYALVELRLGSYWVESQVESLMRVFPVLPISGTVVKRALKVMAKQPMDYYDAQVWAVARTNGVRKVVTEGLWHKQIRDKVLYYDLIQQAPTFGWMAER